MKSFIDDTQLIRIYYDVDGQRRKDLVKALSEILLWAPKYLGAPTFAYDIGNYRITRVCFQKHKPHQQLQEYANFTEKPKGIRA